MFDLYKLDIAEREIKKKFPVPTMYRDILGLPGDLEKGSVCCPFHGERTPSFSYTPSVGDGIWKCFGSCSHGGDTIELYRFYVDKKQGRKISRAVAIQQLLTLPRIQSQVSVNDVNAEPLKFDSFENLLFHEYKSKHKNIDDKEILISRSINKLKTEENPKNFIKQYDDLLKIKWKGNETTQ